MTFTFDITQLITPLTIIGKLCLSAGVGMIIGRERKKNDKPGGARTFSLICLGACNIAMLTLEIAAMGPVVHNFTRLMSYGLASIGFIGSGVIIHNKRKVEGITTAATLWAVVPVGYLIGLGHYIWGGASALIMWFILEAKYKDCFSGGYDEES